MSDKNDRKQPKIVEDGPKYRSVAMMTRQPQTLQQPSFGGAQLKSSPYQMMNPAFVKSQQPATLAKSQQPATLESWNVKRLIPVPTFHKLERTHVSISGVPLDEITRRIVDVVGSMSIGAVYDDKEAKASLETAGCLSFDIRLWSGANGQVIVECQRCQGCGFYFTQVTKKVLKAAKTGVIKKSSTIELVIPASVQDAAPAEYKDLNRQVMDSLDVATDMLKGNQIDVYVLSLQSLMLHAKCPRSKALASNIITSGEILDFILSLIVHSRVNKADAGGDITKQEEESYRQLRRYALNVLANCLFARNETSDLANVLAKRPELVSPELLNTLVVSVASAASQPHEAAEACKCLSELCKVSEVAKRNVAAFSKLMNLDNSSHCRHALLKEESNKLMVELKL